MSVGLSQTVGIRDNYLKEKGVLEWKKCRKYNGNIGCKDM